MTEFSSIRLLAVLWLRSPSDECQSKKGIKENLSLMSLKALSEIKFRSLWDSRSTKNVLIILIGAQVCVMKSFSHLSKAKNSFMSAAQVSSTANQPFPFRRLAGHGCDILPLLWLSEMISAFNIS